MADAYFTTTELRTRAAELVKVLKGGGRISLVHRSRVIGEIEPTLREAPPIKDIKAFKAFLDSIRPKKLIPRKDRERIYRERLKARYG